MEKTQEKYESPRFQFQELRLMERVADRCWGYGHAWVDHDANTATPPVDYWFSTENGDPPVDGAKPTGCAGYDDATRLKKLIDKFPDLGGKVSAGDVKVNTKDSPYINFPGSN